MNRDVLDLADAIEREETILRQGIREDREALHQIEHMLARDEVQKHPITVRYLEAMKEQYERWIDYSSLGLQALRRGEWNTYW